tara:strand:- start:576 stop:947 length:372 start_codon:yes stop_codon:yes gene_type:complete
MDVTPATTSNVNENVVTTTSTEKEKVEEEEGPISQAATADVDDIFGDSSGDSDDDVEETKQEEQHEQKEKSNGTFVLGIRRAFLCIDVSGSNARNARRDRRFRDAAERYVRGGDGREGVRRFR